MRAARRLADGQVELDVAGEGFAGTCRAADELPEGRKVAIVVRPEQMRFSSTHAGADGLRWNGEVVDSIFRGAYRSYKVRTASGQMLVDGAGLRAPAPGAQVMIEADGRAGWALPC